MLPFLRYKEIESFNFSLRLLLPIQKSTPEMFSLYLFEYELFGTQFSMSQLLKVLGTSRHCLSQESTSKCQVVFIWRYLDSKTAFK